MAPTLRAVDGRSQLRVDRVLPHPPEKVWRAVTEPEHLATWFPTPAEPELRAGGSMRFADGVAGTVTDVDPPRLLAFTWDEDHLRFELHPEGAGTRIVLLHTFADKAGAASFAAGWDTCFAGLALTLDGRPGVDPGVDHIALHERYVHDLGLDVPVVVAGEARVERQLTVPAAAAEKVLTELVPAGGSMRWELGEGTGHGARLVVAGWGVPAEAVAGRVAEVVERLRTS